MERKKEEEDLMDWVLFIESEGHYHTVVTPFLLTIAKSFFNKKLDCTVK
jgi:hypothetical protein